MKRTCRGEETTRKSGLNRHDGDFSSSESEVSDRDEDEEGENHSDSQLTIYLGLKSSRSLNNKTFWGGEEKYEVMQESPDKTIIVSL